jgi:hypothetical protein
MLDGVYINDNRDGGILSGRGDDMPNKINYTCILFSF